MKIIKSLLPFILLLSLSGCVPGPLIYFRPISTGGELVQTHCGTAAAPKDTIEFKYDNLQIQVTCYSSYLQVFLYIPEGKESKFTSPDILFLSDNRSKIKTIDISKIKHFYFSSKRYVNLSINDLMVGSERQGLFGKIPTRYEIYIDFVWEFPEHFFVHLPSIIINGKPYEIPEIEFIKERGFGIFPINC